MAETRTMEVKIKAKDDTKKGATSAENSLDKVSAAAGRLAVAGAAAAVALGTAVTAKSLELWAIQEQAILQVEKRLASTGAAAWISSEQLQAMAASLQTMTVFGDEAILQMQSLLLTFKDIQGPQFERATVAILDMASALAQSTGGEPDLRSAATMVGKALQDPILGLTAMSRAGIQFSDSQKDVIKALVETGDKAKAQSIIMDELESQFGGASGAVGLSGAVKQAQNAFGDLFEEFGKGLTASGKVEDSLRSLTDYMGSSETKGNINSFAEAIGVEAGRISTEKGLIAGLARLGIEAVTTQNILFSLVDIIGTEIGFNPFDKITDSLKDMQDAALEVQTIPLFEALIGAQGLGGVTPDLGADGLAGAEPIPPTLSLGGIDGSVTVPGAGEENASSDEAIARNREIADAIIAEEERIVDAVAWAEDTKQSLQSKTGDLAIGLLSTLGQKSEAAQIAAIVLQGGFAISETIAMTAAAQARALAELGPILGPPAVASIGFWGSAQVGLIAATTGAQLATAGDSSSPVDGTETSSAVTQPTTNIDATGDNATWVINVQGNIVDQDGFARELISSIEKAQKDGV